MSTELESTDSAKVLESVILNGDISKLTPLERVAYYKAVCESVGLNPLTQPLAYIQLSGKSVLYAKKDATDQLRKVHHVSVSASRTERIDDVFLVVVQVSDSDGRQDMGTGAVNIKGLQGDALANALMKAETKAKRRATLSICGLGLLDETELETIPELRQIAPQEPAKAEPRTDAGEWPDGKPEPIPEPTGSEIIEPDPLIDYPGEIQANEKAVQKWGALIGEAKTFAAMTKAIQESRKDPHLDAMGHKALKEQFERKKKAQRWVAAWERS